MTDADHAAVLRRLLGTRDYEWGWRFEERAAIVRAIELLDLEAHMDEMRNT